MYGQMTAAGWFYIGTQGILGFTYETFRAVADAHFGGTLAGRRVLTAGLGGMGGAQGFAVTQNGGRALVVEVDPARAERRSRDGWVDLVGRATTRRWRRTSTRTDPAPSRSSETPPTSSRGCSPRRSTSTSSPTRRLLTIRSAATSRAATRRRGPRTPTRGPALSRRRVRLAGRPRRGAGRVPATAARSCSSTETGCGPRPRRRRAEAPRDPRLRRRVCPADPRARRRPVPVDRLTR